MDKTIVLASNNVGKLAEFNRLLAPLAVNIVAQSAHDVPPCDEPYHTFIENALHKARHAARHAGLPALADDSGVCVPSLGGAPGVFSARFAQQSGEVIDASMNVDEQNNRALMGQLQGKPDRRAYYYCVLVLVRHADDPQPMVCDGQWWGEIIPNPLGHNGFGYDPHFYLPEYAMTAAQMDPAQKNAVSHRGQAVLQLIQKLQFESQHSPAQP